MIINKIFEKYLHIYTNCLTFVRIKRCVVRLSLSISYGLNVIVKLGT